MRAWDSRLFVTQTCDDTCQTSTMSVDIWQAFLSPPRARGAQAIVSRRSGAGHLGNRLLTLP
jgi:hypothetical protein